MQPVKLSESSKGTPMAGCCPDKSLCGGTVMVYALLHPLLKALGKGTRHIILGCFMIEGNYASMKNLRALRTLQ